MLAVTDQPRSTTAWGVGAIGEERLEREQSAVDDIVAHCAGLPLALSIVAARAATRPNFALSALSGELRDESRRLDALDGGDSAADFAALLRRVGRNGGPFGLHRKSALEVRIGRDLIEAKRRLK